MSIDQRRSASLARESTDKDQTLKAYERYRLSLATQIADALEKIEGHLMTSREGNDDA
jgi:hypothetical protein